MSPLHPVGVALDDLFDSTRRLGAAAVVAGCTDDWRRLQPGDAFVATLQDEHDGHDYVLEAVRRGAAAVIVDRPTPVFNAPVYHVDDTRVAYGELCHALAGNPAERVRVIGVVGTQGKSTVIALLESIYAEAGLHVGVLSSFKSYDGMTCGPGVAETLTPSLLAARLARMEAAGCTHALVELSSVALAQYKVAGVELDVVCTTVVDAARLDLHGTPQNYRRHLRRAFDYLSDSGVAVFNADDAVSCRWLAEVDAPSLAYGLGDQAQITADVLERNACETTMVLAAGCESAAVRTTIVGDHHVANCLAAAAVALAGGFDLATIAAGIERVEKLLARMERIDCGQDFAVFVDAARTPCGLRASLRTARRLAAGRVICVLGEAASGPGVDEPTLRAVAQRMADLVVAVGSGGDGRPENSQAAAAAGAPLHLTADRGEAIAWAVAEARPGDVVVVAGSLGPTESGFGAVAVTEADIAREVLYARDEVPALRLVG